MRPARAELHYRSSSGGVHNARRFGSDHRLEADGRKQERFGDLRFDQWRPQRQQRLAGKDRRAFAYGKQIAREAPAPEHFKEAVADARELLERAQVPNRFVVEAGVQQVIDRLLKAGCDQEITVRRIPPNEQLEDGDVIHLARLPEAGGHRQLIEIGQ